MTVLCINGFLGDNVSHVIFLRSQGSLSSTQKAAFWAWGRAMDDLQRLAAGFF